MSDEETGSASSSVSEEAEQAVDTQAHPIDGVVFDEGSVSDEAYLVLLLVLCTQLNAIHLMGEMGVARKCEY